VQLAALEIPIRATGAADAQGALRAVETAGKRANAALEQSARTTAQQAQRHFSRMGSEAVRALNAETQKGRSTLQRSGQQLALSLTSGLRQQFARQRAEIAEELARGLLTPSQAQQRGREAALAFNRGVLQVIDTQGAAGAFSGRRGGALFVGLSNQLTRVDQAATQAGRGGIRTLTSGLAQLAAMELGVRSGLGTMGAVLGTLALGSALTLGVVAGLAAIAVGFRKITKDARDAKDRMKEFREEGRKLFQEAQRQEVSFLEDEAIAARAIADTKAAEARRKRAAADKAAADVERANVRQRADLQAIATKLAREAAVAEQDAADARLEMQGRLDAVAAARARLSDEATRAAHEEIRSLAALAQAGIATAADLDRLRAIQEALTAATRTGTAEARAQALALLETVRAAQSARAELMLFGPTGEGPKPKLSKTSPPGFRELAPAAQQAPGAGDARLAAVAQMFTGGNFEQADQLLGFFESLEAILDPTTTKLMTLSTALGAGADAWVQFWEGAASGDLDFGKIIAGFARQMSALFAQQAAAALAMGLTPPPLGNPAFLAAVPRLLAVSAGFALLAGAAGGGRRGGGAGGGAPRSSRLEDREESFVIGPSLSPGGRSRTAAGAYRLTPAEPVVVNQTFYGTDRDPKVHDWFARNMRQAQRRGMG